MLTLLAAGRPNCLSPYAVTLAQALASASASSVNGAAQSIGQAALGRLGPTPLHIWPHFWFWTLPPIMHASWTPLKGSAGINIGYLQVCAPLRHVDEGHMHMSAGQAAADLHPW